MTWVARMAGCISGRELLGGKQILLTWQEWVLSSHGLESMSWSFPAGLNQTFCVVPCLTEEPSNLLLLKVTSLKKKKRKRERMSRPTYQSLTSNEKYWVWNMPSTSHSLTLILDKQLRGCVTSRKFPRHTSWYWDDKDLAVSIPRISQDAKADEHSLVK